MCQVSVVFFPKPGKQFRRSKLLLWGEWNSDDFCQVFSHVKSVDSNTGGDFFVEPGWTCTVSPHLLGSEISRLARIQQGFFSCSYFFFHCRDPKETIEYISDSDGIEAAFVTQLGFDCHFSFKYPHRSLLFAERSAFGFGVCSLPGFQSWFTKKVTIDYRYLNSSTRILGCGKQRRCFLLFGRGLDEFSTFGGKRDETWQVYFPMQKGSVMGVMNGWVPEFRIEAMRASCLLSDIK